MMQKSHLSITKSVLDKPKPVREKLINEHKEPRNFGSPSFINPEMHFTSQQDHKSFLGVESEGVHRRN